MVLQPRSDLEVYRAPMRSRELDLDQFDGARFGVANSVVGIGEALHERPASASEAILATIDRYGDRSGKLLSRFIDIPSGSLVWTQVDDAVFRLGRISGQWFYDDSRDARRVGIHNVRATIWTPDPFSLEVTPNAVIDTFARGGKNLQRIGDPQAVAESVRLIRMDGTPEE